jgi:endonuclease G
MKKYKELLTGLLVIIAGVLYWIFGYDRPEIKLPADPDSPVAVSNLDAPAGLEGLLEIPVLTPDGRLVQHDAYVSSYNTETLIPNWVAYELTAEETEGNRSREGIEFRKDPALKGLPQAMREDYSGSGWTKGHLMPAADASFNTTAMGETFYFTNICPQDETLNAGDWQYLEKRVRQWAGRYGRVWVVTGPIVGENRYGTIGEREVVVPDAFFKALLVRKKNGSYSAIAFIMDNDGERYYLKDCSLSVNELEALTGLDLFPGLDDTVEEKVEGTVRLSDWGIK